LTVVEIVSVEVAPLTAEDKAAEKLPRVPIDVIVAVIPLVMLSMAFPLESVVDIENEEVVVSVEGFVNPPKEI